MLGVAVTPASVQDRDQIAPLLKEVRRLFPFLERAIADSGYQGAATATAVKKHLKEKRAGRRGHTLGRVTVPPLPSRLRGPEPFSLSGGTATAHLFNSYRVRRVGAEHIGAPRGGLAGGLERRL